MNKDLNNKSLDEKIAEFKNKVAFTTKGRIDTYLKKHKYRPDGISQNPVSLSNGKFLVNL